MAKQNLTGYPSIDKPWLQYYSTDIINSKLPECGIYEYVYNCNQDNLSRTAINYYGAKISYKEMFRTISSIAGALTAFGVKKGDVVTVCMINSPEAIFLLLALNKIGAVANMVYGTSTLDELRKYLLDCDSKVVFTLDLFQEKFEQIVAETNIQKVVVASSIQSMSFVNRFGAKYIKGMKQIPLPSDSRFISWKQFFIGKWESTFISTDADLPAVITYTGGTTGGSKGAVLSNRAVLAVAQQYILGEVNLRRSSTWMQVLPLFIAYGVTCSLMIPLIVGMTLIVRIPMMETISDMYRKFKPNHIMYGPAYWEGFADDNKDFDLSALIAPITGGDILRPAVEQKINDYFSQHGCNYPLMNGYGMTEVGAAVSVNYQYAHEFGSVGIPFVHNIIAAFDTETGEELPYGSQGEICIHAPSTMLGYINNKAETDNIIQRHKDGLLWVHSGDLGYISETGFVYISGRLKRYMLHIANGVQKKVFSLDIEKELLKHPKINNCAVVPVSDPKTFQVPVAYIIPKKEHQGDTNLEKELTDYGERHMRDGYRPIRYIVVAKFPLTKVGKIDYMELEKSAEQPSEVRMYR